MKIVNLLYSVFTVEKFNVNISAISLRLVFLSASVLFLAITSYAQSHSFIDSFHLYNEIKVTRDKPRKFKGAGNTIVIFYALPNGNTTDQTMGKKIMPGDDWHFDIQHIRGQTQFIREQDKKNNYVVIYLENKYKSWPGWKQRNKDHKSIIPHLVDSLSGLYHGRKTAIYLSGHSGGGSFIFGYLAGVGKIPEKVKRVSFIDSNYGYDSSYFPVLSDWLKNVKGASLSVFAYNDSVALLNGKPFVSATGGTWYRSHLMLAHLQQEIKFTRSATDSLIIYKSDKPAIQFFLKKNPDRGIYHTQQVELNGFIHSIFSGTKYDSKGYRYYEARAYDKFIRK